MKLSIAFITIMLPLFCLAQNNTDILPKKGKALSNADSLMVKQLYFTALREKTIENNTLATDLFNRVLQMDPYNDAAMYELANLKKLANDPATAQQLLERAVQLKPGNEWYWVALSGGYAKANNLPKLENIFTRLIAINPDNTDYYFDKANALALQKKYAEALAVYAELEKITGPTDDLLLKRERIYLSQNNIPKAAANLKEAIAANPNQAKYYLMLGEIYTSNNLADDALAAFKQAVKLEPGNAFAHLQLAEIYRVKGNRQESFAELKQAFTSGDLPVDNKLKIVMGYIPRFQDAGARADALELSRLLTQTNADDARSYGIYGDMLLQNERYKDARLAYRKSLDITDKVYPVHEQLVRLELGENDADAAIKDGENALTLFPNQAWMNYLVGVAWLQKKQHAKALSYLKNAASLEVQDKTMLSQCLSAIGDCYHEMKEHHLSDAAYDKSLLYNPDNAYTLNNYAYYLSVRNEGLDKAAQMSKRSNEIQPKTASFEDTYAWILFRQKKYSEAKVWIEKAIADDKTGSGVQLEHYGDILFYLGDTENALTNWKKARAAGAQSPALEKKINEKKYSE